MLLPAAPAFPCGDDSQQQSVNNNTSRFGLWIFSAGGGGSARVAIWIVGFRLCRLQRIWIVDFRGRRGSARVRPGRRIWIVDFPGRRRSLGVVRHKFHLNFSGTP